MSGMADGTDCHRELLKDKCSFAWISPQAFCVFYDKPFIAKCSISNLFTEADNTWEIQEKTATLRKNLRRTTFPLDFFSLYILSTDFKKPLNKPKATERMAPIQYHPSRHCSSALHCVSSWWEDAEGALRAHQSHIPAWSCWGRRRRPRTGRWRRGGSRAGRRTAPLPGGHKERLASLHNTTHWQKINFLLF